MTSRSVEFLTSRMTYDASREVMLCAMRTARLEALDARLREVLTANFISAGAAVHMKIGGRDLAALPLLVGELLEEGEQQ